MIWKLFLGLIAVITLTNNCLSQEKADGNLIDFLNRIDSLNSFSCFIEYHYANPGEDTTISRSTNQYFTNKKDSSVGYSFVLNGENGDKTIYDGINLLILMNEFKAYLIDFMVEDSGRLSSMLCSPLSIKNLLKYCLINDSVQYKVSLCKNKDFQFIVEIPFRVFDSYTLDFSQTSNASKTIISIIFDKQSLLPKSYSNEFSTGGITQHFSALYMDYKGIDNKEITAIDSIPSDFNLFNFEIIEKNFLTKQADNFKRIDLKGDSIELYKIQEKFILLEFTSINCRPCREAAKYLNKLISNLKSKSLKIIAIDFEIHSDIKKLNEYYKKEKIKYNYLLNGRKIAADYNVTGIPTFLLIDKDKKIIDSVIGFNEKRLDNMIHRFFTNKL